MADNNFAGNSPAEDKKKVNSENAGAVKNGSEFDSGADKRKIARLKARRVLRRKRLAAKLEKNKISGKVVKENAGAVRKKEQKQDSTKLLGQAEAKIRQDINPRPTIKDVSSAETLTKQVVENDAKPTASDQSSITYFSHDFLPAGGEGYEKAVVKDSSAGEGAGAESSPLIREDAEFKAEEKSSLLKNENTSEKGGGAGEESRAEDETNIKEKTRFVEEKGAQEEIELKDKGVEPAKEVFLPQEGKHGQENSSGEVSSILPESNAEPVGAEEDLVIGNTEQTPRIPIGRISEFEPPPSFVNAEIKQDVAEDVQDKGKVAVVDQSSEVGSGHELKKSGLEQAKIEPLTEKESFGKALKSWILNWPKIAVWTRGFFVTIGSKMKGLFKGLNFTRVFSCLLLILVLGGGYYAYTNKLHQRAYSYLVGFFQQKPAEKVVKFSLVDQRMYGISTAAIFGSNLGSVSDLIPVQISMAVFFGKLMEPKVQGETGITALTFYGELKDGAAVVNEFVAYMQNLADVQNLYKTDVYAMLDRSTARDEVLLDYQNKLKEARDKSQVFHDRIVVNMDDFTKSYNSLSADKARYERDFFAAMENLEPEKSDLLIKGFIDISQKQLALKARIRALAKLEGYYKSALQKLDLRIKAVEQNRDALIQGIRVVDIPGADLNIIIKSS